MTIVSDDLISTACKDCKEVFKKSVKSSTNICYECKRIKHNKSVKKSRIKKEKAEKELQSHCKNCITCSKQLTGKQELFCSVGCRKKTYSYVFGA